MSSTGWSKENVALVTGSNRGIGYEIVRLLVEHGLTVVLTARDESKGKAAVENLQAKGLKTIVFHQLDPTKTKSVESIVAWLKSEYGGIDILINNAAILPTSYTYEAANLVFETNFYAIKNLNASLLPLLRSSPNGARIVNITSRGGLYERLKSESVKDIFRDEDKYSERVADSIAERYLDDMKAGQTEEKGWIPNQDEKSPVYSESKMCLNVYACALARSLDESRTEGNGVFVAGVCPGVTLTDMVKQLLDRGVKAPKGMPMRTPAEGAETPVWLALLPKDEWKGKTGKLFGEKGEYPFGWKNPPL